MKVHIVVVCFFIHSSYQQDVPVCPIGHEHINGVCVPQVCPSTHVLKNGECQLKPVVRGCREGFDLINGLCVERLCPNNHIQLNGACHPMGPNVLPPPNSPIQPTIQCPVGYTLYQGMCYGGTENVPMPCQQRSCGIFSCPTCPTIETTQPTGTTQLTGTIQPTGTTTTATTTTTTTPAPGCPKDSVLIDGECRLIYCPKGTVYNGRCLEPVCLDGLVWTGSTCSKPAVITTVLEIENVIVTEFNQTGPDFHQTDAVNKVIYHTQTYESSTEGRTPCPVTPPPTTSTGEPAKCCSIFTPRICKQYTAKWVCFNRQYRRCDHVCGNHTVIYLRIAKVTARHPILVMPPNPPLSGCTGDDCATKDPGDCSGCIRNDKSACSTYCYRYRCPKNTCTFIDQSEYCTKFPGSDGCSSSDGCLDDWCFVSGERPMKC